MNSFRLGVRHLPRAEAGLVRALVALLCNDVTSDLQWVFVDEAECDAMITDRAKVGDEAFVAAHVLFLTQPNTSTGPNILARPLRADLLRDWLAQTQAALLATRAITTAATPARRPQTSSTTCPSRRYKLRKWPPRDTLGSDMARVRMATLLGIRALTMHEFVQLSRVPVDACESFLQQLQQLQLIDLSGDTTQHASNTASQPFARPKDSRWSLVRSIRSRLGLT